MIETGIIGGILGLLGRLAPEVLKFFQSKNELAHELKMLEITTEAQKYQQDTKVEEKYVDYSIAGLEAIAESAKAEAELSKNNYKLVNGIISLQRPYITFFIFNLYMAVKFVMIMHGIDSGLGMVDIITQTWTKDDFGLLAMVVGYLFVDRSIQKYRG